MQTSPPRCRCSTNHRTNRRPSWKEAAPDDLLTGGTFLKFSSTLLFFFFSCFVKMQLRSLSAIGASQKVADRWPRPISMSQWLKRETFPLKASSDSDRQRQIGGLFTVRTGRQPFTATSSAVNNPHPHRIRPSSDNPLVKKKFIFILFGRKFTVLSTRIDSNEKIQFALTIFLKTKLV